MSRRVVVTGIGAVTALGLTLHLTKDSAAPNFSKSTDKKAKGDAISGVDKPVLTRNVVAQR